MQTAPSKSTKNDSSIEKAVEAVAGRLYETALKSVPRDVRDALTRAAAHESNAVARDNLNLMLRSVAAADQNSCFICQDVGVPTYVIKAGTGVPITFDLNGALCRGLSQLVAVIDPPLLDFEFDPLTQSRRHPGHGEPITCLDIIPGADHIGITCVPFGLGSGTWGAMQIFGMGPLGDIERFIIESVLRAGGKPCPPMIVSVGIGGTVDKAARLAKEGLVRPIGGANPDAALNRMEARLLKAVNETGIGPMGLGGDTTALAVHIEKSIGHGIIPVVIMFNCWPSRRAGARIYGDGRIEYLD